jgi:hypothetical protein
VSNKRKGPVQDQDKKSVDNSSTTKKKTNRNKELTYEEVDEVTKEFMSFEWDNREVQRYNLFQNMTPTIYWHFVSNQFFPLKTFDLAQNFEEHFQENIRSKFINHELTEKEFMSLYNLDHFKDRVEMLKEKHNTEQLFETIATPENNGEEVKEPQENTEQNENIKNVDGLLNFCNKYLDKLEKKNSSFVNELSDKLKKAYDPVSRRVYENALFEKWEKTGECPAEMTHWNLQDIYKDNMEIYTDVAAIYLEDLQQHMSDYFGDKINLLIDSWYATKTEEKYLHYVAEKHQEKNEINSKQLLQRINDIQAQLQSDSNADSNAILKSHPLTISLLNERRQKEEDAKCSICGSGDYEENDLIVFCGFCGIAVHQGCYGVEEIPEGEWFCISCFVFGKK